MSYKVVFKGNLPDEFVEDYKGRSLAEAWEQDKIKGRIRINENIYDGSSIKAIVSGFQNPDSDTKHEDNKNMMRKVWDEYRDEQSKALKLFPEVRAKNTGMAEIAYLSQTGTRMPEEIREKVMEAQAKFFNEHRDWSLAHPSCYRHLIKGNVMSPEYHVSNFLPSTGLGLVERVMSNAIGQSTVDISKYKAKSASV